MQLRGNTQCEPENAESETVELGSASGVNKASAFTHVTNGILQQKDGQSQGLAISFVHCVGFVTHPPYKLLW